MFQIGKQLRILDSTEHLESESQMSLFMENLAMEDPIHAKILDKHFAYGHENSFLGLQVFTVTLISHYDRAKSVQSINRILYSVNIANEFCD